MEANKLYKYKPIGGSEIIPIELVKTHNSGIIHSLSPNQLWTDHSSKIVKLQSDKNYGFVTKALHLRLNIEVYLMKDMVTLQVFALKEEILNKYFYEVTDKENKIDNHEGMVYNPVTGKWSWF